MITVGDVRVVAINGHKLAWLGVAQRTVMVIMAALRYCASETGHTGPLADCFGYNKRNINRIFIRLILSISVSYPHTHTHTHTHTDAYTVSLCFSVCVCVCVPVFQCVREWMAGWQMDRWTD